MSDLLLLGLIGGLIAVDGVAAVQSMISRPLVVGWGVGALLGVPMVGAQVGIVLELYLLVAVPSGGGRYPEGGTGTLVAVAAAAASLPSSGALAVGVASGLVWGWIAGESQSWIRRWNERRADSPHHHLARRDVNRAQRAGLAVDFARGGVVTLVGVIAVRIVAPRVTESWPLPADLTGSLLLAGALASLGIVVRGVAVSRARAVVFGVGLLAGALLIRGVG
mgnify:CR=1 FL=1